METQPLTELECHALAHLDRSGPMSGYRLRCLFASSPTDTIAASAGGIYPLLRRLERRGLLAAQPASDGRGTRLLTCTAAGRAAVRRWLRDPRPASVLAEDGLRSRTYFIDRLEPRQRIDWLRQSLARCRSKLEAVREFQHQHPATTGASWAQRHAEGMLQARIDWLEDFIEHTREECQ